MARQSIFPVSLHPVPMRQRTGAVQNASRINRRSEHARAFGVRQFLPLLLHREARAMEASLDRPARIGFSVRGPCQPPILQMAFRQNAFTILAPRKPGNLWRNRHGSAVIRPSLP
jgi:hypothetical protein